jgi:hypothetical protein
MSRRRIEPSSGFPRKLTITEASDVYARPPCHCERSEAISIRTWPLRREIAAAPFGRLAMTILNRNPP